MYRLIACMLLVALLGLVFFPTSVESHAVIRETPMRGHHRAGEADAIPRYAPDQEPLESEDQTPSLEEPEAPIWEPEHPVAKKNSPPHQRPISNVKTADSSIEDAIARLSDLIPDEVRMKGLLSPLTETGEALLRDLAYRTRAFTEILSVWETLHLVPNGRELLLRDVVPQLRAMSLPAASFADAVHTYDRFRAYVNKFAARLFPWTMAFYADHMSLHASFYSGGKGMVLTAGDSQAQYLLTTIPSFRRLGCDLPIEVLYLGDEDLSEDYREQLEALPGVLTRDLSQMVNDEGWTLKGWAMKPFAILMSSFREVLFVDADALFFANPQTLFDDEQYTSTGALFFKDRNLSPEKKRGWLKSILPNPISDQVKKSRMWTGESGHMQDSGVLLIDKWQHFVPLLLATRLNGPDRDGNSATGKKGVYEMVYGDKETFWLSWELAGDSSYAFHDSVAGTMGLLLLPNHTFVAAAAHHHHQKAAAAMMCSPQLLHFDREGRPLWFNGWLAATKDDEDEFNFHTFEAFLREPRERGGRGKFSLRDDHVWTIHASNVVCLEADEHFPFTAHEHGVLDMMMDLARENLEWDRAPF